MKRTINMLEGSLWDKILQFAIPIALTSILQQVFNAADTLVVGNFCGKDAMAAVGSNGPMINLLINLFIGLTMGANVVLARVTGEGRLDKLSKGVHTSVLISLLGGVFLAVLGFFVARPVLKLMGVPENVMPMSLAYFRIYMGGMPVILLYNFCSAIFRSQGDTRTPLAALTIGGVANVGLNIFFVTVFGMDADGVAIATVISNLISSLILVISLMRTDGPTHLSFRHLTIEKDLLKDMIKIGMPAGLQGMAFSISNILVQSSVNSLGTDVMAATSAALNLEAVMFCLFGGFSQASTTFIGQNYGAGNMERCRRAAGMSYLESTIATVVVSALIVLFRRPLLSIFNRDPAVIHYGEIRILYIVGFEFFNMTVDNLSSALRGYGNSLAPALIALFGICVVRVVWILTVFAKHHTMNVLMTCYPLSWIVADTILVIYYFYYRNKMKKKGSRSPKANTVKA